MDASEMANPGMESLQEYTGAFPLAMKHRVRSLYWVALKPLPVISTTFYLIKSYPITIC